MAECGWVRVTRALERRTCGLFQLFARDDGRWEVSFRGELVDRDFAQDMAGARRGAESALHELLDATLRELVGCRDFGPFGDDIPEDIRRDLETERGLVPR